MLLSAEVHHACSCLERFTMLLSTQGGSLFCCLWGFTVLLPEEVECVGVFGGLLYSLLVM